MWPSVVTKETYANKYQQIVFGLTLFLTVCFVIKLFTEDQKRLHSLRSWITLIFSASVLVYTCPESWIMAYFPKLRHVLPFNQAYIFCLFMTHVISDISLVHLPSIFSHIAWFGLISIDVITVSFKSVAIKDTINSTRTDDFNRIRDAATLRFEDSYSSWCKMKLTIVCALIFSMFIFRYRMSNRWRDMTPVLAVISLWVLTTAKGTLPYKQYELVQAKLHLDMAYLPLAVLVYQYLCLSGDRSFILLPASEEREERKGYDRVRNK